MKPRTFLNNRLFIVLLAAVITVGLISWDYQQTPGQFDQPIIDTTPQKKTYDRDKKVRNLDDVLVDLNEAELQLDMEKMQKEIADAMKSFDSKKIQLEIANAMKSIDMAKIQQEVQASLAKVDFTKIQVELATVMKSMDMAKIQKEVQESLAKVDWTEMKAELEKVKNMDLKKIQNELKEIGPKLEKDLKNAKIEIEKAKAEIKEYKNFVDGLDSDGLIDKKTAFSLKHQDGELLINGEKASQKTYSKYRRFLEKHKKFNIRVNDGDFKIDMD